MTCEPCTIAAANPRSGLFRAGCRGCAARALAGSPTYHSAEAAHRITPDYRAALAVAAEPGETLEATHRRVRDWDRRILAAPLQRPLGPGEAAHLPAAPRSAPSAAENGLAGATGGQP
jgi:hypothetical protein